jgi:hypothetical protein
MMDRNNNQACPNVSEGVSMAANDNPHFNNIPRAPYELGHLLLRLPTAGQLTSDDVLVAEAARKHAMNASDTLLSGLEALGQMMFVAATNNQFDLERGSLASLGCLISHIAVEQQFLQETEWSIREKLDACEKKGGK